MKLKNVLGAIAGVVVLALSSSAGAITLMIGDNDGYGYGNAVVPDGAALPTTSGPPAGCTWCFDNRSAAELAATNGAQYTDFEAYAAPVNFSFAFDASAYTGISNVMFSMDVTGIQQGTFGASHLYLDGVDVSAGLPSDQGAWGSGVFSFSVSAASLLDGLLNVSFTGGPSDHIGFDYFALNFDARSVPEPTTLSMLGLGLALLGIATRKRKAV